jgi:hypothetical protein
MGTTMYFTGRWTKSYPRACIAMALSRYFHMAKRGTEEGKASSGRILIAFGTHFCREKIQETDSSFKLCFQPETVCNMHLRFKNKDIVLWWCLLLMAERSAVNKDRHWRKSRALVLDSGSNLQLQFHHSGQLPISLTFAPSLSPIPWPIDLRNPYA